MSHNINLDDFIQEFYKTINKRHIVLEILNTNSSDINIYDVHHILLNLIIAGFKICNLTDFNHIELAFSLLQKYFDNIKIIINFQKMTISDILNSPVEVYDQRYARIDLKKIYETSEENYIILNGKHINVNELGDINTFISTDDQIFYSISFDHSQI